VARVQVHSGAVGDLDDLIQTHSLPADARERFRDSLHHLQRFPRMGIALAERWTGHRMILGPWRWMVIVYRWSEQDDVVTVMAVEDARSGSSPTLSRL
jgi:plasmid stabilization system protein ParE